MLLATLVLAAPLAVTAPAMAADVTVVPHEVRSSEGTQVSVDLLDGSRGAAPGTVRLLLDGLPAGSTLSADGHRAVVPSQGMWTLGSDGRTLSFAPAGLRIGRQPTPILYTAQDEAGEDAAPAVVTITTPVIPDLVRAAPFGEPFTLPVGEVQQNVEPSTLRLITLEGEKDVELSEDGSAAVVPGQGTWTLDRSAQSVRFTPESADVRRVAPIGISGEDGAGDTATPARLSAGYPALLDRTLSAPPGQVVQFTPMDASRAVRGDSLALTAEGMPTGSRLEEDGQRLVVPDQGTWTVDRAGQTVSFTPVADLESSPTPVSVTAGGLYAQATTTARLAVQYTDDPPTARDDRLMSAPGRQVSLDLLADDSAGRSSRPLDPGSVRLQSLDASNLDELRHGEGTRVVLPGEGTFAVRSDGVLTFTPVEGFVGRTTPIRYSVKDIGGYVTGASIVVSVDAQAPPTTDQGEDVSGIAGLVQNLLPARGPAFAVFGTIALLLTFAGAVAVWIGGRMEIDRRTWND